ncbi:phage tail assembly chaperone [Hymenobacter negativus]|uniref:Phage tail assembly chaperone n=1 Tax=Hymenobacter negativus TaxID=2795026 RepID=A0ABS0Q8L5_9BACT|nr:phage tail assembly chaperone [Hymenobacter negativus]MBH8558996.1 phage tail assembly chaperone [Hymenobacter negativus]
METFGIGELGLKPKAFWRLTWREYRMRADAFHRQEIRAWRRTRWLGTILLNVHRGEDDPAQLPEEVLYLPGDPPLLTISPEELDAELARVAALDPDWL